MSITVTFSDEEVQFVSDLLVWWQEGLPDVIDATTKDPTLESFEDLTILTSSVSEQERLIEAIHGKIDKAV